MEKAKVFEAIRFENDRYWLVLADDGEMNDGEMIGMDPFMNHAYFIRIYWPPGSKTIYFFKDQHTDTPFHSADCGDGLSAEAIVKEIEDAAYEDCDYYWIDQTNTEAGTSIDLLVAQED